jgi:proteic killer suppression protein
MVRSFPNAGSEVIFNGSNTADARRLLPRDLWTITFRKLDQIDSATDLNDLKVPPGNRLEALKAERQGQHSIRINQQYRICFVWTGNDAVNVEITDYH